MNARPMGRQHGRNGIATLRTEKSQGTVTVTLLSCRCLR